MAASFADAGYTFYRIYGGTLSREAYDQREAERAATLALRRAERFKRARRAHRSSTAALRPVAPVQARRAGGIARPFSVSHRGGLLPMNMRTQRRQRDLRRRGGAADAFLERFRLD